MLMSGRASEALGHHSRALERRQDRLEMMGFTSGQGLAQGPGSAPGPGLAQGLAAASGLASGSVVEDVDGVFSQLDRLEVKLEVALSLMAVGQCHVALGNIRKVRMMFLSRPLLHLLLIPSFSSFPSFPFPAFLVPHTSCRRSWPCLGHVACWTS